MSLRSFTLRLTGIPKGHVDIGPSDSLGNRSFTFTPTGLPPQPVQSINVFPIGNPRAVLSREPFRLTIDDTNYDRLVGFIDLNNRTGVGTLRKSKTLGEEEALIVETQWDCTDVATHYETLEPDFSAVLPHVRSFNMKLSSGQLVGHVDFGNPDSVGNRTLTFTNTGGGPQPPQNVTVTRIGNVRNLSSGPGFTLTMGTHTYTGISGSLDLLNKHAQGFLIDDRPGHTRQQLEWSSDDIVTPVD